MTRTGGWQGPAITTSDLHAMIQTRRLAALGFLVSVAARAATADLTAAAVANRQPLRPTPLIPLPLGSVRPAGWLRTELQLQCDGLTGHAEQVIPRLGPDSGWLGGTGKDAEDWEKGPYYVKGLVALAYTLDDPGLKQKAQRWIDWSLNSQLPDGSFGPLSNNEWWPRMVMTYALRQYAEATGDPRVVPFLTKYLHYMLAELPHRPLKEWAKSRAGDQIDTAFWLYNRTGDPALLQLARLLHAQAYDWTDILTSNRFMRFGNDFQPRHAVNIAQAMKMPAVWYQQSGESADRNAFQRGLAHLLAQTTLPLDVTTGTESLSGRSAIQGVETCTVVEQMLSDETALGILNDPAIADALERTAYNALPGAMTKDLKLYQYYTATNNVAAVRGGHGFSEDYPDGMMPGPVSGFPCCCYNLHMGWPMFVQHAWMATRDGGVAAAVYGPTTVHTTLPDGESLSIAETTNYPFDGDVHLVLSPDHPATFPVQLRVPGWCTDATLAVNGTPQPHPAAGHIITLNRAWSNGDRVDLTLPMPLASIPGVNDSVSLARGPLVFSLKLPEHQTPVSPGPDGFVQLEITSPDAWNFALHVDRARLADGVAVHTAPMPATGSPFEPEASPVSLSVPGRQVPSWRPNYTGRVAEDPPASPLASDEPEQTVTLVPFGAQTLRVTAFPWLGTPAKPPAAYRCDFDNTDAPGWVTYGGNWFVEHHQWCATANANTAGIKSIASGTDFADFTYDADITPAASGDTGLIFRVGHPSIGDNAFDGYYAGISPDRKLLELGKCTAADNAWTPLANAPLTVAPGEPVHLSIAVAGELLRVYVRDATLPTITITDATFTHGSIGVRHYATSTDEPVQARFAHLLLRSSVPAQP